MLVMFLKCDACGERGLATSTHGLRVRGAIADAGHAVGWTRLKVGERGVDDLCPRCSVFHRRSRSRRKELAR